MRALDCCFANQMSFRAVHFHEFHIIIISFRLICRSGAISLIL
jgi:hypothetical protein